MDLCMISHKLTTLINIWFSIQVIANHGRELCGNEVAVKGLFTQGFFINSTDNFETNSYASVFHCDNDCKSITGCTAISFHGASGECKFYNQTGMKKYMAESDMSTVIRYVPLYCQSFNAIVPGIWSDWQIVDPWKWIGHACRNIEKRVCESSMPECEGEVECEGESEREITSHIGGDLAGVNDVKDTGIYCFGIGTHNLPLYCEVDDEGKVWIHIQRRVDGSINFFLNWYRYRDGFGDLNNEFWLGNYWIHHLTAGGHYKIRFEMSDGIETRYMEYNQFVVGPPNDFQLTINYASGNAGEAMFIHSSGALFSAHDWDRDKSGINCANAYKGGWWYGDCHGCNPNGRYLNGSNDFNGVGITWEPWKGNWFSLPQITMKITKNG